jgi:hypothetical protein
MAECLVCGKKYHACGSCGLQSWEYDWCSDKCADEAQNKAILVICAKFGIDRKVLLGLINYISDSYLNERWPREENAA